MNQFLHFIANHWLLWATLVIIVILIILEETRSNIKGVQKLASPQAIDLLNHQNALVVDLRNDAEFATGHILDAINIPAANVANNSNKLNKYKNRPLILLGNTDQAAVGAALRLRTQGFDKLYLLSGGMLAWQKSSLPVVKNN